jgi:hypothetical protein
MIIVCIFWSRLYRQCKHSSVQCTPFQKEICLTRRFPGFIHLSFWYEQRADEDEQRELVEWYWQGRNSVLGDKSASLPLCAPKICLIATLSTTNLPHCHIVHHKSASLPLCPPQICLFATLSTTNLPHCHFVHHKSASLPLCPPQICLIATSSTTNLTETGLGLKPSLYCQKPATKL